MLFVYFSSQIERLRRVSRRSGSHCCPLLPGKTNKTRQREREGGGDKVEKEPFIDFRLYYCRASERVRGAEFTRRVSSKLAVSSIRTNVVHYLVYGVCVRSLVYPLGVSKPFVQA